MDTPLKSTGLHDWHVAQGARLEAFGGYRMPLWYSSARIEHLAVLTDAGLFDTSHMAAILIEGPGAHDLLQAAFTQNLDACIGAGKAPLSAGRCVYGAFLTPAGHVIDDSIIFMTAGGSYMAVVNAGMGPAVARHLEGLRGGATVSIRDMSDRVGKIDLQGPRSGAILSGILADPARAFDRLAYFSFKGHFDPAAGAGGDVRLRDGTPVLLSRTGYTGEFGFEIFLDPAHLQAVWELLLATGREANLIPCGLAARDSLRAGAVLPLSHQDIGDWPYCNHPWPFALPWNPERSGFTKPFVGDKALLDCTGRHVTLPFAGFDLRKVSSHDPAGVLDREGRRIGRVLTCVSDMGIGREEERIVSIVSPDRSPGFEPKGLCCGFVRVESRLPPRTRVTLADKRRAIEVEIVADIRPHRTARKPIDQMLSALPPR